MTTSELVNQLHAGKRINYHYVFCLFVHCLSSTIFLSIFSSQTAGPVRTKFGRNVALEVLFENYLQNLIPSKTDCRGNKWKFSKNSFKIFYETTRQILK